MISSYITHVSPPSPMEVKKLMENLVLRGLSLGISPSNAGAKNLHTNKTIDSEKHMHKHTYINTIEKWTKYSQNTPSH